MSTYDLHAHIMTRDAIDAMRTMFPEHSPRLVDLSGATYIEYPGREPMGPLAPGMFDLDIRLHDMGQQKVDVQLLSVPPSNFFYHLPAEVGSAFSISNNDAMCAVASERPDRFQVFATLPLQDVAAAVREIERVRAISVVRGVEIGTNVDGVDLDADQLDPVWQALVEADLPVWIHPDQRTIAGSDRLTHYYLQNLIGNPLETTIAVGSLIFGGVLDRHPLLRVGLVHGGGFAPYQLGRWRHGWEVRAEARARLTNASPESYFARLTIDSLTHSEASLRFLGETYGWDRVVVGSDYPFDMGPSGPVTEVEALHLDHALERAVRTTNAEAFLRKI